MSEVHLGDGDPDDRHGKADDPLSECEPPEHLRSVKGREEKRGKLSAEDVEESRCARDLREAPVAFGVCLHPFHPDFAEDRPVLTPEAECERSRPVEAPENRPDEEADRARDECADDHLRAHLAARLSEAGPRQTAEVLSADRPVRKALVDTTAEQGHRKEPKVVGQLRHACPVADRTSERNRDGRSEDGHEARDEERDCEDIGGGAVVRGKRDCQLVSQ